MLLRNFALEESPCSTGSTGTTGCAAVLMRSSGALTARQTEKFTAINRKATATSVSRNHTIPSIYQSADRRQHRDMSAEVSSAAPVAPATALPKAQGMRKNGKQPSSHSDQSNIPRHAVARTQEGVPAQGWQQFLCEAPG